MASVTAGGGAAAQSFSTRAAARILAVSPDRIRYWVRHRLIQPSAGDGRQYRFAFNDLLVMRLAKELLPTRRHLEPVQRCLERVRGMFGSTRPVTALRLSNEDGRIVVRDRSFCFEAESGQLLLDFASLRAGDAFAVTPLRAQEAEDENDSGERTLARNLFNEILGDGASNAEVHLKVAGVLERDGDTAAALKHLLKAATLEPTNTEVHLRLGALYRGRGDNDAALKSFLRVVESDDQVLEAHRNLADLYEQMGRRRDALRHLSAVHRLTRDS